MGDHAPDWTEPALPDDGRTTYGTTEAADVLRVPPKLLRYVLLEHKIPRETVGLTKVLTRAQVEQIDRLIRQVDPDGTLRHGDGVNHRGRKPRSRKSRINLSGAATG
jgi:hypothetical protein